MSISYETTQDFSAQDVKNLYLSVEWDSGNHPDQLQKALKQAYAVVSAWDNGKLVGLVNCLSDGHMAAYIHYVLVRPEYQGTGVGRGMMQKMLGICEGIPTKVLISVDECVPFYEKCKFKQGQEKTPMFLTSMSL